jgi:hypothetical protein
LKDQQLADRLRAALPPTRDIAVPRDLWPSLVERLEKAPSWSMLDVGLCAAVAASLLVFPEWLWVFVYHL